MTRDVLEKSLNAMDAQVDLIKAQLAVLRHGLLPPKVSVELPAHCDGVPEARCGLRTEDARISQASLPHPNRWVCSGCRVLSTDGITT